MSAEKTHEFDIALSFAGEDRQYVEQVANLLIHSGVKVFYDRFEEAGLWGKNLYDHLSDIYKNKAFFTIIFISKHYDKKLWANHERQAAQARAFEENKEYILPARFDETPIPGILPTIVYISLTKRTPTDFVEIILKKLISSGRTVPSEGIRRSLFSTSTVSCVNPKTSQISISSTGGHHVVGATVVAIADNDTTTKLGTTGKDGLVTLIIPIRRRYRLLIAHPNYPGVILHSWDSAEDIRISLMQAENTGSIVCLSTGYIPGLEGRLNPILDTSNRTYLYADNIAINGGKNQPVTFKVNDPFELEDSNGVVMQVKVLHIQGRTSLIQYVHMNYES
jgi:hypothetical protein